MRPARRLRPAPFPSRRVRIAYHYARQTSDDRDGFAIPSQGKRLAGSLGHHHIMRRKRYAVRTLHTFVDDFDPLTPPSPGGRRRRDPVRAEWTGALREISNRFG